MNQTGADFYTVRVEVDYISPAHFDDEINAYVRTSRIGRSSLEFEVGIYQKDTDVEIVRAKVVWVNVDQKSKKPVPLPEDLIQLLS